MAEGGTPQNVYNVHVEGGGTFIAGDHVREKSEITVPQGSNAENNEGDAENEAAGQAESECRQAEVGRQVSQPELGEKGLTWLVKGKIVLYKKRPLNKATKTAFYGRQQVFRDRWREIAIKIIPSEEKNLTELDLLMKLRHPNIVQLIDAIEREADTGDNICIVMELCYQNLRAYVDENDFDFQTSFSFVRQIIEGLIYLHENNVTHRDLKPDNVLISFCKKYAKLSDFGLSKEIPEGLSKVSVTTIGAGTEGFRAPETYQNDRHVAPSIDVFSFGLVAHFTFTKGKHPFGPNPYKWSANIMENQNRDLTQIPEFQQPNSHKRQQLIDLLCETLQPNPKERPTMKDTKQSAFIAGGPKDSIDILQGMDACQPSDSEEKLQKATSGKSEEEAAGGVVEGSTSALEEPKLSAIPISNVEETEQPEGAAAPSSDTEHAGDAVERTTGVVEKPTSSASPSSDVKESEKSEVAVAPSNVTDETVETAVTKVAVNDERMQKSEASAGDGGDGEVEEDVSPSSEVKDSEQSEEASGSSNATGE